MACHHQVGRSYRYRVELSSKKTGRVQGSLPLRVSGQGCFMLCSLKSNFPQVLKGFSSGNPMRGLSVDGADEMPGVAKGDSCMRFGTKKSCRYW